MAMDAQEISTGNGLVEEDVVGLDEFSGAGYVDAEAEDVAAVNGVGVGILDAEGGDACAGAVEIFLCVGALRGGCCEEERCGVGGLG